jgi:fatty-acid desaturase
VNRFEEFWVQFGFFYGSVNCFCSILCLLLSTAQFIADAQMLVFFGLQGSPIDWVSTHRYHHQFCDSERDPHSPTEGFWYSHMSWLFDTNSVMERV